MSLSRVLAVLRSFLCPDNVGSMRLVLLYINFIYVVVLVSAVIVLGVRYGQNTAPQKAQVQFDSYWDSMYTY